MIIAFNVLFLGILPLVFENPSDYDKIQPDDRVSLLGLADIAPGKVLWLFLVWFL